MAEKELKTRLTNNQIADLEANLPLADIKGTYADHRLKELSDEIQLVYNLSPSFLPETKVIAYSKLNPAGSTYYEVADLTNVRIIYLVQGTDEGTDKTGKTKITGDGTVFEATAWAQKANIMHYIYLTEASKNKFVPYMAATAVREKIDFAGKSVKIEAATVALTAGKKLYVVVLYEQS